MAGPVRYRGFRQWVTCFRRSCPMFSHSLAGLTCTSSVFDLSSRQGQHVALLWGALMSRAPRPGRHSWVATAAVVACALGLLSAPPVAAAPSRPTPSTMTDPAMPSSHVRPPVLTWAPCDDGFECSTATVPLDYDRPAGPTISLALIRLPASSPYDRIGSLFMNPGGPGVRVSTGPGGAGTSTGRPCPVRHHRVRPAGGRSVHSAALLRHTRSGGGGPGTLPLPGLRGRGETATRRQPEAGHGVCRPRGTDPEAHVHGRRGAGHGPVASGGRRQRAELPGLFLRLRAGSDLRQSVPRQGACAGCRRRRRPDRVDNRSRSRGRTTPFSARIGSDTGAQQTLRELFRLCDEAGPNCAFAGNSSQRYAALLDRLREHPVDFINPVTNEPITVDDQVLIAITLGGLYQPAVWPIGAQWLAALEQSASEQQLGQLWAAIADAIGAAGVAQPEYPNVVEGSDGVACSDSLNPRRPSAWPRTADAAERRHGYFGRIWTWTWSPCAVWPRSAGQDRYLGPWTARTANPVLIVGNYYDPATRYQGAVTASHLLPNSGCCPTPAGVTVCPSSRATTASTPPSPPIWSAPSPRPPERSVKPEGSPFDTAVAARSAAAGVASRAVVGSTLPDAVRRAFS